MFLKGRVWLPILLSNVSVAKSSGEYTSPIINSPNEKGGGGHAFLSRDDDNPRRVN